MNNFANMHIVHMQYTQRWCYLYCQASEQSSNTNEINRQLTIDSTSNVSVLLGKQSDNASRCVGLDNVFIRKMAYTVVIIVVV